MITKLQLSQFIQNAVIVTTSYFHVNQAIFLHPEVFIATSNHSWELDFADSEIHLKKNYNETENYFANTL